MSKRPARPGGLATKPYANSTLEKLLAIAERCSKRIGGCENCPSRVKRDCHAFWNTVCDPTSNSSRATIGNLPQLEKRLRDITFDAIATRVETTKQFWSNLFETKDLHTPDGRKVTALIRNLTEKITTNSWEHIFREYDLEIRLVEELAGRLPNVTQRG